MTEMTCHVHHVFLLSGNLDDVISLESRPLIFVYLYTCTQSIQKQIIKCDIKSKYPEEYSTIDKASNTYEYLNLQLMVTPL